MIFNLKFNLVQVYIYTCYHANMPKCSVCVCVCACVNMSVRYATFWHWDMSDILSHGRILQTVTIWMRLYIVNAYIHYIYTLQRYHTNIPTNSKLLGRKNSSNPRSLCLSVSIILLDYLLYKKPPQIDFLNLVLRLNGNENSW